MKIYFMAVVLVFVSMQAMACIGAAEETKKNFVKYDMNKDGYIDKKEFDKNLSDPAGYWEGILKSVDKDGNGKLSEDEFVKAMITDKLCM